MAKGWILTHLHACMINIRMKTMCTKNHPGLELWCVRWDSVISIGPTPISVFRCAYRTSHSNYNLAHLGSQGLVQPKASKISILWNPKMEGEREREMGGSKSAKRLKIIEDYWSVLVSAPFGSFGTLCTLEIFATSIIYQMFFYQKMIIHDHTTSYIMIHHHTSTKISGCLVDVQIGSHQALYLMRRGLSRSQSQSWMNDRCQMMVIDGSLFT